MKSGDNLNEKLNLDRPSSTEESPFLPNSDTTTDYLRKVQILFNSGDISVSILKSSLKSPHFRQFLNRRQLAQLIMEADRNRDGRISFQELKILLNKADDDVDYRQLDRFKQLVYLTISSVGLPGQAENYLEYYKCCPPPLFMLLISLVEIAIFVFYGIQLQGTIFEAKLHSGGVGPRTPLIWLANRRQECWRFISYMLLHSGYLHISFNVVYQLLYGIPLEMVHSWRIVVIYMAGVLAGSFAHSLFDILPLVGASGGGYALLGAHLANVIMNWKEMNSSKKYGVLCVLMSAYFRVAILTILIVLDLSMSLNKFYNDPNSTTGYVGHLGGFVSGLLMGVLMLDLNQLPWERRLKKVSGMILLAFVIVVVLYNCLSDSFPPTDWRPCCPMWF